MNGRGGQDDHRGSYPPILYPFPPPPSAQPDTHSHTYTNNPRGSIVKQQGVKNRESSERNSAAKRCHLVSDKQSQISSAPSDNHSPYRRFFFSLSQPFQLCYNCSMFATLFVCLPLSLLTDAFPTDQAGVEKATERNTGNEQFE